jgi:hypothetical protein
LPVRERDRGKAGGRTPGLEGGRGGREGREGGKEKGRTKEVKRREGREGGEEGEGRRAMTDLEGEVRLERLAFIHTTIHNIPPFSRRREAHYFFSQERRRDPISTND